MHSVGDSHYNNHILRSEATICFLSIYHFCSILNCKHESLPHINGLFHTNVANSKNNTNGIDLFNAFLVPHLNDLGCT